MAAAVNPSDKGTGSPAEGPLARRVIRSGFWAFALRISYLAFYFARIVILVRILDPRDFGTIGMALLMMSILEAFTQTGTLHALIQKKDDIRPYLDAAWTVSVLRGAALGAVIFAGAPLTAAFFGVPDVVPIIRGYGIVLFIGGFINTGVVEFQKNLQFERDALLNFAGNVTNFAVVVAAALILRNVWAFVCADIAQRIVHVIMSYRLHPYRPKWSWRPDRIRELFRYGRWVSGASGLVFLTNQGDDILVGKVLGPAMLGFYQMAFRISNTPTTEVSAVIGQVMFATYAKLQGNALRLKEAYFKTLQIIIAPAFMLIALLFALGSDFVRIVLHEDWLPMVPAMQLLAISGAIRAIIVTITKLMMGVGRPQTETGWEFVRLIVLALFIFPLTIRYGLPGAAGAVLISLIIPLVGYAFGLRRQIKAGPWEFWLYLFVPAASAAVMTGAAAGLRQLLGGGIAAVIAAGLAGAAVFFAAHFLLERMLEFRSISFFRDRIWPIAKDLARRVVKLLPAAGGGPGA